jgi:acetyl-CoA carboxylase carboxyl transferase subunit beta
MAEHEPTTAVTQTQAPSDDIWSKCPSCKEMAFRKEVERNLNVCPKCGYHFRVTVAQRLSISVDRGTWRELMAEMAIGDPLGFVDSRPYPKRMEQARASSGRNDAVVVGLGKIENRPVAIGVMDFEFMGGSMGVVVGEKLARLFDLAGERKLPVILFVASGGARMQEGALSLMQMAKVSSAIARFRDARLPYISVLCDPTTGGVAASFAMLGDLNFSEPGALIGFADFQRAEFLLAHGMLDAIVPRHQMRFTLARILAMLSRPRGNRGAGQGAGKGKRRGAF